MQRDVLEEFSPLFFSPRRWFMDRYIEAGFENLYPVKFKENEILGKVAKAIEDRYGH